MSITLCRFIVVEERRFAIRAERHEAGQTGARVTPTDVGGQPRRIEIARLVEWRCDRRKDPCEAHRLERTSTKALAETARAFRLQGAPGRPERSGEPNALEL